MKIELKGGKTAPRLLQDFLQYDPSRLPSSGYNILADPPLQYQEGKGLPLTVARNRCRHEWVLKSRQSNLPKQNRKPDPQTIHIISACCIKCRSHLELEMDFRGRGSDLLPCPNEEWPLHHFVHMKHLSQTRQAPRNTLMSGSMVESVDSQCFQCSSSRCSAKLTIRISLPRLNPELVNLISDPNTIRIRAEKAVAENLERLEGHSIPLPMDVLTSLCQYIDNALNKKEVKTIQGINKKFLLYFGESCAELFQFLGFKRQEQGWEAPSPEPNAEPPFQNPLNVFLDDVYIELLVLRCQRPLNEQRSTTLQHTPVLAMLDIMRALGCVEYKQSIQSRKNDQTEEEHPFYAGLGATWDFHDELIGFAYNRQTDYDPRSTPYYLECLQGIGEGRKSEALQTLVAIEASKDKISLKEIRDAYKDLGLANSFISLDDDTIIGTFQSRISDAPRQEPELRRALKIVGQDRASTKIQHVASNVVSNHEQALLWLAASEDTSDDFLLSMYHIKVDECPSDEKTARHAVSLIADYRNSDALKSWLATGVLGEVEMDVGQAYNRFGISDRTIDDDTILTAYNFHVIEAPSQRDDLRSALTAIAKSRNSRLLQSFLNSGMVSSEHPLGEWPVGLENIGNTCYLNSLLQFYFTVKPLREIVLNFDEYKMKIEFESLRDKRVGSRKVSKKEIERAQRFVFELQKLFRNMITAPRAQVTPEQELARLTLISSVTEEHIRRQSILSGHRPSLGEIDGRPVLGPLLPPSSQIAEIDSEMTGVEEDDNTNAGGNVSNHDVDNSSEDTLVEGPAAEDPDLIMFDSNVKEQQQILEDKENLPPSKTLEARPSTPETELQPLAESSPSRTNEQLKPLSTEGEIANRCDDTATDKAHPPNRPPPFPPRPKPEDEKILIREEVEIGAQQDVTEVIQNVLFQLQCAIKAESVDDSGEQLDQIKRLFYGKQKSYTTNREGSIRTKEDFFSDIKVDVASGPRSIYAALDGAFDVQEVEVGGALEPQYTTISQLPPVLQIMVQRAQYDPQKKASFKSTHHLDLIETIYMDRYMDSDNEDLMERRRESWIWKKELALLEMRKSAFTQTELGMEVPQVLDSTASYLQQLLEAARQDEDPIEIPEALITEIESVSTEVKDELPSIEKQIKTLSTQINSQFNDLRTIPYRLHSVFIHRGYVSSGHYWIYIYDFSKKIWRKYNDGYVTEVKDVTEIFERDPEPRPATPYFLVYIKDTLKDELVDPVCRDIQEPTQESQDVEMLDVVDYDKKLPELPKNIPQEIAISSIGTWDAATNQASTW